MADNKIDYRQMYPNRSRKSRTPDRTPTPKPKKEADLGLFKPVREKTPEKPSRSYVEASGSKLKDHIRELVLNDPAITVDDIAKNIRTNHGAKVSPVTISNIKTEFRGALKFLDARGHLKGINLKKGDGATKR